MARQHRCPKRRCAAVIDDRLFACGLHWWQLSAATRTAIYRTANMDLLRPERGAAILSARREWGDVQPGAPDQKPPSTPDQEPR
jgi:hypothetical protein